MLRVVVSFVCGIYAAQTYKIPPIAKIRDKIIVKAEEWVNDDKK